MPPASIQPPAGGRGGGSGLRTAQIVEGGNTALPQAITTEMNGSEGLLLTNSGAATLSARVIGSMNRIYSPDCIYCFSLPIFLQSACLFACEFLEQSPLATWKCSAKCSLSGKLPECQNTFIYEDGTGKTRQQACINAQRNAGPIPRGCQKRHCDCKCSKR